MKAVSSLVSELLLLVITVFLAVTIYGWTAKLLTMLSANPLPPIPEVTDAYLFTVTSNGRSALFLTLRVPNAIEINGVYVYAGGNLICSSSEFLLSADDPKANEFGCKALRVAGYYGSVKGLDDEDSRYPGLILFSSGCQRPAVDEASSSQVGTEWFYLDGPGGYADKWTTVIAAVPQAYEVGGK
ncbi:hypothetical protein EYM_06530 [Ignicoccus islandicus DSM 13165]|uniref:Uncharacterized protein n=1 Tax=Ignicoccus islandicus DSM 13165 TaxID=940295 RepID=A0A0U3FS46_9CREN|nr:hypothetical protein [Ignicoccus islandicus]ALU12695.1 hypothetical protein EYM_06530 [Ignicoccus islandicus DSM 13165]